MLTDDKGFTLVEVMVVLILLTLSFMVFLRALNTGKTIRANSEIRTVQSVILSSIQNEIRARRYDENLSSPWSSLLGKELGEYEIKEFDDIDVPFAVIEDVPIFPGCESVSKSERRACFQDKINQHIRRNFRYPDIAQEMGIQGRVYVNFIIAKDGSITNIRMRGPDKNLENEAQRIISRLPRMTPGKQRGKAVNARFTLPIKFRIS